MADASDVARLVHLNGGQLIGKTRLQKSAYFLDAFGAGFGYDFDYHRFGPYSEDLTSAIDDAKALHFIEEDWKESQSGVKYAIFNSKVAPSAPHDLDGRRQQILKILAGYSAIEVELAATADFLRKNGFIENYWIETQRRKTSKVNEARLEKSKKLLRELSSI
jgi:uncharacterized protein YwgA